ncbi:MAG TPA: UDP-N-acetylmuramate--alanine ligase [Proteobacteria bacterium]|nr:UDP-N-acetylmuramate--alanine ligase [Pseudomonadota bacterium]
MLKPVKMKEEQYFFSEGKKIHFVGIGGVGMSALAQMARWQGSTVSGSDRFFDRGELLDLKDCLEGEGIIIFPQDGSGISDAALVVSSAAVESDIPDLIEAKRLSIPLMSRGEYLLRLAEGKRTLAVAGTNGKSTTTAILSWILEKCGYDPTFIIGAAIRGERRGWGNGRLGESEWFCFEADESDGILPRYQPSFGIINNISPDHLEIEELREVFSSFAANCREGLVINRDCPESRTLPIENSRIVTFSVESPSICQARSVKISGEKSLFELSGENFIIPLPGRHNLYNGLAAIAAASLTGLSLSRIAEALIDFPGIKRRLEIVHSAPDLIVIDDYSHNPAKITAALAAAHLMGGRITAIYQPHGFGPLRRFHREIAEAFSESILPGDRLFLLPVYYAGGTVQPGYGSEELAGEIRAGGSVMSVSDRAEIFSCIDRRPAGREVILVMGARDPSLSELARNIVARTIFDSE